MDRNAYPWGKYLLPDDKISTHASYDPRPCLEMFEKRTFPAVDEKVGDLTYYFYDPTLHGYPADGKYPLIFALHGAGAALHGIEAVAWSGAAMYASPAYQERMGGAYILVPLANEVQLPDGTMRGLWMSPAKEPDHSIYQPEILAQVEPFPLLPATWMNLSLFYPLSAGLIYIAVCVLSFLVLKEKISVQQLIGMVVILAGIVIMNLGKK